LILPNVCFSCLMIWFGEWFGSFCSTGTVQQAQFDSLLLNDSTTNNIVILLLLLSLNGPCCVFHTFPVSLSGEMPFWLNGRFMKTEPLDRCSVSIKETQCALIFKELNHRVKHKLQCTFFVLCDSKQVVIIPKAILTV
ncbi:hypothetical protein T4B_3824, partial [Trichinella pseudospiralis]